MKPTVGDLEGLTITTVIDGYVDMFAPSTGILKRTEPGRTSAPLQGGHGSSFLVDCRYGEGKSTLLIDGGLHWPMLEHNLRALGLDPRQIDAVVLTHGHPDHYRGLEGIAPLLGEGCPIYLHPGAFLPRMIRTPRGEAGPWSLNRETLESAGLRIITTEDWLTILPGVHVTGTLPEDAVPPAVLPGNFIITDGGNEPDRVMDEMAVVFDHGRDGPVVLTSCAHRWAPAVLSYVSERLGSEVYGLIAGFHLSRATPEEIRAMTDALAGTRLRFIIAGHCTGFEACAAMRASLGDRFHVNTVGAVLEL